MDILLFLVAWLLVAFAVGLVLGPYLRRLDQQRIAADAFVWPAV